jgi:hypothetical protein
MTGALAGCPPQQPPPPKTGNIDLDADPCAQRLGGLCEELLLYYSMHKELPQSLADLKLKDAAAAQLLVCPKCGKPYKYDPGGLLVLGWPGRLIVYDAEPCHAGLRWGIVSDPPRPGQPLIVRPARPPEKAIVWEGNTGNP